MKAKSKVIWKVTISYKDKNAVLKRDILLLGINYITPAQYVEVGLFGEQIFYTRWSRSTW